MNAGDGQRGAVQAMRNSPASSKWPSTASSLHRPWVLSLPKCNNTLIYCLCIFKSCNGDPQKNPQMGLDFPSMPPCIISSPCLLAGSDLLLMNGRWPKWWDVTFELGYKRLWLPSCQHFLTLPAHSDEASWGGSCSQNQRWLLANSPGEADTWSPKTHKTLKSLYNYWVSLDADHAPAWENYTPTRGLGCCFVRDWGQGHSAQPCPDSWPTGTVR